MLTFMWLAEHVFFTPIAQSVLSVQTSVFTGCYVSERSTMTLRNCVPYVWLPGNPQGYAPCRYPTLPVAELQRHQAPSECPDVGSALLMPHLQRG